MSGSATSGKGTHAGAAGRGLVGRTIGLKYRLTKHLGSDALGDYCDGEEIAGGRPVLVVAVGAGVRVEKDSIDGRGHPNLVPILDRVDGAGGRCYVVLERPRGRTVEDSLGRGERFGPGATVAAAMQVLSALHAIHQGSRYHGALSAANVFLSHDQDDRIEARVVHVGPVDFEGVPREPFYQAPERVRPGTAPDRRIDLWSVGVLLHEMLSGERPFVGGSPDEVVAAILRGSPPAAAKGAELPEGLPDVLERLLAADPDGRFPNVTTVLGELLMYQEDLDDRLSATALSMIRDSLAPPPPPAGGGAPAKPLPALGVLPAVLPLAAPAAHVPRQNAPLPGAAPAAARALDPKKTSLGLPPAPIPPKPKPAPAVVPPPPTPVAAGSPAEISIEIEALPVPEPEAAPGPVRPAGVEEASLKSDLEAIEAELFPAADAGIPWPGSAGAQPSRRRRPRWLPIALAGGALAIAAVVVLIAIPGSDGGPAPSEPVRSMEATPVVPPAPEAEPEPEPAPAPEPAPVATPEPAAAPAAAPEPAPAPKAAAAPAERPTTAPPPATTKKQQPKKKPGPAGGEKPGKAAGKTGAGYSGWASNPFGD